MIKSVFLAVSMMVPTIAAANCYGAGQTLFSCGFSNGKSVHVCLSKSDEVTYRFGVKGEEPELELVRQASDVHMQPWHGVGRAIWEVIRVTNSGYAYEMSYSIDRMDETIPIYGSLTVLRGDETLAILECVEGTVARHDFSPLFEAKEQAGQNWCANEQTWSFKDCQ
ncbi:hypothetical protein BVC71_02285 [Marivivens niveibacter]|uniref:Uncharacterized protein n=1 Tax=Marivivens niveibacter TaxID=1930667 RepID=A0A251X1R8_9RHOB|nr:hypothetical protein [Marivivens niveibacter]OUD10355.1 hypothetical protein BVC71_02285 [Marivivens niveibacter]